MKKIISISIIAFFLSACNQVNSNSSKAVTEGEDTLGNVDISLSKLDLVEELAAIDEPIESKLVFKASGTEPGWFAEFYENKLRLVVNYGKDSLILNQKFKDLDNAKGFAFSMADAKNTVNIAIDNKSCINPGSGNKEDRAVTIELNKIKYKGCGSFVK